MKKIRETETIIKYENPYPPSSIMQLAKEDIEKLKEQEKDYFSSVHQQYLKWHFKDEEKIREENRKMREMYIEQYAKLNERILLIERMFGYE